VSRRTAGWLAWSLCVLFVLMQALAVWEGARGPTGTFDLFGFAVVGYAIVGALVASRRPGNALGWLLLATALAFAVGNSGEVYVVDRSNPGRAAVGWVASWAWILWVTLSAVFLPLVFPDGRLLSRRWRPVAWLGGFALALTVAGMGVQPGHLALNETVWNPLGLDGAAAEWAEVALRIGGVLVGAAVLLAAASLVLRFRRARGVERQQLKWFAFAGLLALTGLALAAVGDWLPAPWSEPVGGLGWSTFLLGALVGIPVAIGIAILRHRLFDIDIVINRALVYGTLTVALAAAYLVSVLVLRLFLSPATGHSDLAVAASTLAVAALFRPLRNRIQGVVDRRFFRQRYDAVRTLDGFVGRLRDELDLDALGVDLRRVVDETMQPAHVSLWLRSAP
jgi:hypothetical protein